MSTYSKSTFIRLAASRKFRGHRSSSYLNESFIHQKDDQQVAKRYQKRDEQEVVLFFGLWLHRSNLPNTTV